MITITQANQIQACMIALEQEVESVATQQGLLNDRKVKRIRRRLDAIHSDMSDYYVECCGGDVTTLSGGGNKTGLGD